MVARGYAGVDKGRHPDIFPALDDQGDGKIDTPYEAEEREFFHRRSIDVHMEPCAEEIADKDLIRNEQQGRKAGYDNDGFFPVFVQPAKEASQTRCHGGLLGQGRRREILPPGREYRDIATFARP